MTIKYNKLAETVYRDILDNEKVMYCEIQYNRDRSSFAGVAFEILDRPGMVGTVYKILK